MASNLFWNQPPIRDATRSLDPLGFDALREAMADKLVPLLTGATRDADEYLWTLIGLRWARETTGSQIDATIFSQGFSPFERALKQYWYKSLGRTSSGVNVIRQICDEAHPNIRRPILVDQRTTGLLGNYIVSLRGMRLVEKDAIRALDDAADRLLGDLKFAPRRGWHSSWAALDRAFASIKIKTARHRLGLCLFGGEHQEMRRAARSALARPEATSWALVERRALDSEQARLAAATTAVIELEAAALAAFAELLRGKSTLSPPTRGSLRSLAAAARNAAPYPSTWSVENPLRSAIDNALSALARGRNVAATLLRLHTTVTREVRHTEPWLQHLGDMPAGLQRWRPNAGVPDFRFRNLRNLIKQTQWKPDDH